ncbi:MAG TPA: CHAD domain-containing protein [Capsulimonadaceae bacterium]|jgi:CHAD domain-containing protein
MDEIEIIGPDTSFRTASQAAVEKPLAEIFRCLGGVREGGDIEAVHDLRVATRRLRAVVSVIAPAFEGKPLRRFEKTVSDMTDHLGEARDTDVFIEFLDAEIESIDEAHHYEKVGLYAYRDFLKERRQALQNDLETALAHVDEEKLRSDVDAIFAQRGTA